MSSSSQPEGWRPPLSVQQISDQATQIELSPFVPLKNYLRTADVLVKEVLLLFPDP